MEFNKRTILWIVFAVSLFVLWNDWMVANGKQSLLSNAPPAKVATAPAAQGNSVQPNTATTATVPGAPGAAPIATRIVTVATDLFKVDINTAGGVIQRLELLKYRDKVDQSKNQLLFHVDSANGRTYLGQTGLAGNSPAGPMPSHSTPFTVRSGPTVDSNGQVQLVLEAEQGGVRLTKTFTFKRGDYVIGVRHDVANVGTAAVNPVLYLQLMHDGSKPEGDTFFNSSYTGPTLYTSQDKYQKLTFDKIAKGSADHSKTATDGWIAISQHFFVSAFVPPAKLQRDIET
ncbi:MAG: YidC/Oxa1 family membrane protein insertase, partial [Oxalobacteraceae bacterium]